MIIGSTGTGKSVLADLIEEDLLDALGQGAIGKTPCLRISAVAPDLQAFSYKDFYIRGLQALQEPLIDRKLNYGYGHDGEKLWLNNAGGRGQSMYRRAFEAALKARGIRAILIDEAQSMIRSRTMKAAYSALESLKTLLNILQMDIVLFGNDELLDMEQYNDQFNKRIKTLTLGTYNTNEKRGLEDFIGIISTFKEAYQKETGLNPLESPLIDHLIANSYGCIGLLVDQLQDISIHATCFPERDLSIHLQDVKLSDQQIRVIRSRQIEHENTERKRNQKGSGTTKKRIEPNPRRLDVNGEDVDKA